MVLPFQLSDLPNEFECDKLLPLSVVDLKFLSWIKCNTIYPQAKRYLYVKFSTGFVWDRMIKDWRPRRRIFLRPSVITKCHDHLSELYYLHKILHIIRGPCSYVDLLIVNGFVHYTFKNCYTAFDVDNNH